MDESSVVKTVIAAIGTAATYLLGGWDAVLMALGVLACLDYARGGPRRGWVGRLEFGHLIEF